MKLKKVLSLALGVTMAATTFVGCGSGTQETSGETNNDAGTTTEANAEVAADTEKNPEDISGEITFITQNGPYRHINSRIHCRV